MSIEFASLLLDLPNRWADITAELAAGSPPTLARADGSGVLQFSVAAYGGGAAPGFDVPSLRGLLDEFASKSGLVEVSRWDEAQRDSVVGVGGDFRRDDEFIRAWYASNGADVALVTFLVIAPTPAVVDVAELAEATSIVRSLRFVQKE